MEIWEGLRGYEIPRWHHRSRRSYGSEGIRRGIRTPADEFRLVKYDIGPQKTNIAGWEIHHLKMYLLLQMVVFHCYVTGG